MEEIVEEMLCSKEPVESEEDEIEEEVVPIEEAQRAWSTVRKFLQQRSRKPGVMQACHRLDNEMYEILRKNMRQPTILKSFGLTESSSSHTSLFPVQRKAQTTDDSSETLGPEQRRALSTMSDKQPSAPQQGKPRNGGGGQEGSRCGGRVIVHLHAVTDEQAALLMDRVFRHNGPH